jgi:hypothetical protein
VGIQRKVETLSTTAFAPGAHNGSLEDSIQQRISTAIDETIDQLPSLEGLTSAKRRGIIARYSAVLEGNFIYWMTATLIAVHSEESRDIITENLYEEIRDSHPLMMRRFAVGAHAFPTDGDALAVDADLTKVRLFMGKLESIPSLVAMAFLEGFIQRFMEYLAALAAAQGSTEMVYTDVHGVCDIEHTQGLLRAISLELASDPASDKVDLFEGVDLLQGLIQTIVQG